MYKLKIYSKPKPIKMKCSATFPPIILANLQEKEVIPTKEVQEIVADKKYDGLSKVTVQSIPNEYIVPSGEIEFTQNGTYDVTDKASAKVNIKEKVLGTKTITSNGTYKAIDDNLDGYSEVEVATSGVDIWDYYYNTISKNAGSYKFQYLIKKVPLIDTSNETNLSSLFSNLRMVKEYPIINTSKCTIFNYMFTNNESLIYAPLIDLSNAERVVSMFEGCIKLETIPLYDTSKVKDFSLFLRGCPSIKIIPAIDTSNAENVSQMFYAGWTPNVLLTSIPKLNFWNVSNISNFVYSGNNQPNLTTLGGFENLGQAYLTTQNANYSNYTLNLSKQIGLTEQSLINVLTNLYDIATKGVKPQTVTLGSTNLAKLVSEEGQQALAQAQQFGWNIN